MYPGVYLWLVLAAVGLQSNSTKAENYTGLDQVLLRGKRRAKRSDDYCSMPCEGKMHTMCMYKDGVPGEECAGGWIDVELGYYDKVKLLHLHNEYRSQVASGRHPPQPPATDMIQLVWDKELSQIAQRWVAQCHFGHDACRNSARFPVGQNMAVMKVTSPESGPEPDPKAELSGRLGRMVDMWFREIEDCPPEQVQSFTGSLKGAVIGHYTQMVWGSSRRVGCAASVWRTYPGGGGHRVLHYMIGCNYGPAGNINPLPVYATTGSCPDGTTPSQEYNALCTTGEKSDFSSALSVGHSLFLLLATTLLAIN